MSVQRSLVGVLVVLVIVAGVGGYFAGSSAVPPPVTVTSTSRVTVSVTAAAATVTVTSTVTQPPKTVTTTITPPPTTVTVTVTPSPTPPPIAWPTRPVTIVVGMGAGGGSDLAARAYAPILQNLTGVPWTVVNMPGGGGAIGETYVIEQPADGYTILLDTSSIMFNVILQRIKYKMQDFIPICRYQWDVTGVWIRSDDPRFKNITEFLAFAKVNEVRIGGTGLGRFDHIAAAVFAKYTGIKWTYISYDEAPEMHLDLLAGKIEAMIEQPGPIITIYKEGKVKPILFFEESRLSDFSDTPVGKEVGIPTALGLWRGLFVKNGTPTEIVSKLEWLCSKAYESPDYKDFERKQYLNYKPGLLVGDAFRKSVMEEYKLYDELLTELGLK
ncbi:MAG: tripartite tricarboxylate transporter substrate binding protein [Sulfolobales archaeon]